MKEKLQVLARLGNRGRAAVAAGLATAGGAVMAAPPASVVTDLTAMGADGKEIATLVLLAIIAIATILFLKKAIR